MLCAVSCVFVVHVGCGSASCHGRCVFDLFVLTLDARMCEIVKYLSSDFTHIKRPDKPGKHYIFTLLKLNQTDCQQ